MKLVNNYLVFNKLFLLNQLVFFHANHHISVGLDKQKPCLEFMGFFYPASDCFLLECESGGMVNLTPHVHSLSTDRGDCTGLDISHFNIQLWG